MAFQPTFVFSGFILHEFLKDWKYTSSLELNHLSLSLLVASQFEVLTALQRGLLAVLAVDAFHTQHDFLRGLGLKEERKEKESCILLIKGGQMLQFRGWQCA